MNWEIFSLPGYASVLIWLTLPVLWFLHWRSRPRRWLCHVAVVVALLAFALAKVNSLYHVNRIEEDRSEQIAKAAEAIAKDRKRKEEERSEDVANVRFVEDSRDDYLDKGGMDEGDKAYYEGTGKAPNKKPDDGVPAWKRQKQSREFNTDEGLEGKIGAVGQTEGANTESLAAAAPAPVVMSGEDKDLANRLDGLNLKVVRFLIWFGVFFVFHDYLRRFNSYEDAYSPVPLPASWPQAITPLPVVQQRPLTPRRDMVEELAFLIRRGDAFLYLTDDQAAADAMPATFYRLPGGMSPVEVLPVQFEGRAVSPDFVFESLWFGRCAFVASGSVESLLARFSELLAERKARRARALQPVQLVWDRAAPVPEILEKNISILGPVTGISLFICSHSE